jgi:flagellar motor switch protein FliG
MTADSRHKAAALLTLLDQTTVQGILKDLSPKEIAQLGRASLELKEVQIEEDFLDELLSKTEEAKAMADSLAALNEEEISEILRASMGDEKGNEIFSTIQKSSLVKRVAESLDAYSAEDLYFLLDDEPLQAVALVLPNLSAQKAAKVLELFQEGRQLEILQRMVSGKESSNSCLYQILEYILQKAGKLLPPPGEEEIIESPIEKAVSILKKINPETKDQFLSTLEETERALSDEIKDLIFPFEDLAKFDSRTMQKVLMNVDSGDLVVALKSVSPAVGEAILSNLSKRARENIMEEKDMIGAIPLSQVKEAQKKVVAVVQQMVDSGEINLVNQEEDPLVE